MKKKNLIKIVIFLFRVVFVAAHNNKLSDKIGYQIECET